MELKELLAGSGAEPISGTFPKLQIQGVSTDSREVKSGDLFVAIPGTAVDGSQFVVEAIKRGASVVVSEKPVTASVPVFLVPSARKALAVIAANHYRKAANEMSLIAITGTNGKTTTAYLTEAMCAAGGSATGLIGTIEWRYAGKKFESTHTTPGPLELHKMFRAMVDGGTETVVMEVSSHALSQERVHGLSYRAAAFTNLTRDHLDYHKDVEEYFQVKRRLFLENLTSGGVAVVNGDDTYGNRIYNEVRGQRRMAWKFSRQGNGELSVAGVEFTLSGIRGTLKTPAGDIPLRSKLIGSTNLENILAAAGLALGVGLSRRDVQDGIERMGSVSGRMERVEGSDKAAEGIVALVDYAHTDDALRRSLEVLRGLCKGRIIVVFGCGGERDRGKRPLMGQAAAENADVVVITSDNPRGEDPEELISQIIPGVEKAGMRRMSAGKAKSGEKGYLVDTDRSAAIQAAVNLAKPGDVVLVAGKGHEKYQIEGSERRPFDDREEVSKALTNRS